MTVAFAIQTIVMAPPNRVFAASLSIDDHLASMAASGEQVIGGVTTGQLGLGQNVTIAERVLLSWYLPHLIRRRNDYLKTSLECEV